uniref:Uncharacterized protein n=1 Tax=viral metagenome TaxID=1070528 RepID=A0A6C0C7I0_9ZZZZ
MANKIDGLVSLLKTGNLVIIDMLIESHCINDEMLLLALQRLYLRKCMKNIDLFWILANYLEGIIDKETLDKLFINFIDIYPENDSHEKFSPCFMKLCDMGAQSEICNQIIIIPADLFFYYLSKNEPLININIIKNGIRDHIDDKICHWIFEHFMSVHQNYNNNDVCGVVITAYLKKDKSYFEKLMQIVYDRKLNDIVMLNVVIYGVINEYNIKYVSDCEIVDELMFLNLLIKIVRYYNCSMKLDDSDANDIKTFLEENGDAKKIFDEISNTCDCYDVNKYNIALNNIITLKNMYHSQ